MKKRQLKKNSFNSNLKRLPKRQFWSKNLSKILFTIASIGFIGIAILDTKISDLDGKIDKLNYKWEDLIFDIDQSTREYYGAFEMRNHARILFELGAPDEIINEANESLLIRLRQAIIISYKSATDNSIDQSTLSKINNLKSYSELWNIYESYLKKSTIKISELVQIRLFEENSRSVLQVIKIWLLYFFILLMVIGFIIEIHDLKQEKQNVIEEV